MVVRVPSFLAAAMSASIEDDEDAEVAAGAEVEAAAGACVAGMACVAAGAAAVGAAAGAHPDRAMAPTMNAVNRGNTDFFVSIASNLLFGACC